MNKVIKSILFGIAFFPLTGCLSNLDLHPIDSDTPNTFFKDSAACAKVLVGCYDALSVPGGGLFDGSMNSQFVIWNVTDEMYNAAAGTGPKVYSYTSGYAPNATMYKNLYAAIQRCCQFLHYLPDAKMTTETKLAMEGEVQFIRAFCYFNLVQNYGRVPLVTEASSDVNSTSAKQAEEADIYDFVIREMEEAESKVFRLPNLTLEEESISLLSGECWQGSAFSMPDSLATTLKGTKMHTNGQRWSSTILLTA